MKAEMYLDASLPISERVEDLLARMSVEEKVRQLGCSMMMGTGSPEELDVKGGIGEVAIMGGGKTPEETAAAVRVVQQYILDHSDHHIPAIFHCEALSGPVLAASSLYPTSISLGATFDPDGVREMCVGTRRQMAALGIRQALSPVLDISRDLRWGRVSETYGGDPTLNAAMSCAFVEGLQGEDLKEGVAATAKHFLGYSQTEGGLNMTKTISDERDIREVFAKPFEAVIRRAGIKSVMNSYSEYNGKPVCASKEVLTNLLRGELGFDGLVVSDYMSIPRLVGVFHTAENLTDAGKQCLEAGLDVECPNREGYGDDFIHAAKEGEVNMEEVDRSVRRVLKLKFELGLFENPFPREASLPAAFDNRENNQKSLKMTREVMTLTKNEGLLPVRDRSKKIAVIGPVGDSLRYLFSCYTFPSMLEMISGSPSQMAGLERESIAPAGMQARMDDIPAIDAIIRQGYPYAKTVTEGLRSFYGSVSYTRGCHISHMEEFSFGEAEQAAKEADIVILTVGGKNGWGLHCTTGEGVDSSELGLPGRQEELMRRVYAVNPNMAIVHTDGRPLVSEWAYEHVPAILEAWLPCAWGGQVIAETIAGENIPGGRMPMDLPKSTGMAPVYHYMHNGCGYESFLAGALNQDGYINGSFGPMRPFGYGLSYTTFAYSELSLSAEGEGVPTLTAEVSVANTGDCAGDEVVQLYGQDAAASIIRPRQELIGFQRVHLQPGECRRVAFRFRLDQLSFIDSKGDWILEKGAFRFFAGPDSETHAQEVSYTLERTIPVDPTKRGFFAEAMLLS